MPGFWEALNKHLSTDRLNEMSWAWKYLPGVSSGTKNQLQIAALPTSMAEILGKRFLSRSVLVCKMGTPIVPCLRGYGAREASECMSRA